MNRIVPHVALMVLALGQTCRSQDVPRPEHPTPDAVRPHWANLNGKWDFRFDPDDKGLAEQWSEPGKPGFDRAITVPFPWESELSGIKAVKDTPKIGWYRRTFAVPKDFPPGDRTWLRFGAVDYRADVWVNGKPVATHEGGYSPFEADVTDALKADGDNVVVVRAFDPTDPSLPTGKQVNWYTTTSGIWQTVWLESVPKAHIGHVTMTTTIDPPSLKCRVQVLGWEKGKAFGLTLGTRDQVRNTAISLSKASTARDVDFEVELDWSFKPEHFVPRAWSPEAPNLYDLDIQLSEDGKEESVDSIKTYFGLRTIARGKLPGEDFERVLLNGKPIFLRGALDQSFNPQGIYTAPTDEFLKRDIELAKAAGTNFLRIHIKPDEPRRLYWADKLGMLIMEDMPNSWQQNARARTAWESTLRETIARDKNHPSIFAWVDFNETWGLCTNYDAADYRKDKDTQNWVKSMVALTRQLDPTRLVEDNSPCNYDHVEGSDLNSWHFYIDDHDETRKHIESVVARSHPGSDFNHAPGEKMNSAPLINSEYGSVSAGGGDRDVSWGFRDMTTQLRRHAKIQGYIYTELSDIEWEHNGFYDYDRSKKEFGYDAFVPGMTPADLQGADFIGYDAPPAIEAKVGEVIRVPLFVSHYSTLAEAPKLRWWVVGTNDKGEKSELPEQMRAVEWTAYGVKVQKPLGIRIKEPFVGALAMVLEDSSGKKIAANFVNLVVKAAAPAPRVERLNDHTVAIRFAPNEYAKVKWSGGDEELTSKAWGRGTGSFAYRLKLPEAVAKARPKAFTLLVEAGSKNDRGQVDWNDHVNAQDNPQTDASKMPSVLEVAINGEKTFEVKLADDPADARGVLSHLRRVEHGGYGEIVRKGGDLPASARESLKDGKPLELVMGVPDGANAHGLSLYGADAGAYPFDPTVILETEDHLPEDLGVKPDASAAIDTVASRKIVVLKAGDSRLGAPSTWAYATSEPAANWTDPGFDDSSWKRGGGGFGTANTPALQDHTLWDTPSIWLRSAVDLPAVGANDTVVLHMFHDEDVQIFVNGKPLFAEKGYATDYRDLKLDDAAKALFQAGKNTIAVRCTQTGGGQGIDLGVTIQRRE